MNLRENFGTRCRDWCWVRGMALGAEDGVGQGGVFCELFYFLLFSSVLY